MKIKNKIKNYNKLIKSKLIKTKIYKKNHSFFHLKIEDIEYRLKKALHIIYKYHVNGKKIFFIGNSSSIETEMKSLLNLTNHTYLSNQLWLNGTITNQKLQSASMSQRVLIRKMLKLKNNSNLIVVLDKTVNDTIINESYKSRIPVIFLGNGLNNLNVKFSYIIPGNFLASSKKVRNHFFLVLLKAVLKRSNQVKNNNIKQRILNKRKFF